MDENICIMRHVEIYKDERTTIRKTMSENNDVMMTIIAASKAYYNTYTKKIIYKKADLLLFFFLHFFVFVSTLDLFMQECIMGFIQ